MAKLGDPKLGKALDPAVKSQGIKGVKRDDPAFGKKKPKLGHDEVFEESCAACKHEAAGAINALFMKWTKMARLSELSGIDEPILKAHFEALDMPLKRSHNTDAAMSFLMELKMGAVSADDISVADLVAMFKHRDKLNKRVDSGENKDRPTVIVIQGLPGRGQLMQTPEQAQIEKGEVRVLGPGGKPRD